MAKPFALTELEARVRALTRRSAGAGTTQLRYKRLSFDLNGRTARIDGNPLELSARETNLQEIFLSRCGHMISKNQFVDMLCEGGEDRKSGRAGKGVTGRVNLGGARIINK